MAKFQKGQSGNPKGRPIAARGLRAALVARYGDDGALLVERLEALSKLTDRRNAKLALDATELLLAYHSGKPTQAMEVSGPEDEALKVIQVVLAK